MIIRIALLVLLLLLAGRWWQSGKVDGKRVCRQRRVCRCEPAIVTLPHAHPVTSHKSPVNSHQSPVTFASCPFFCNRFHSFNCSVIPTLTSGFPICCYSPGWASISRRETQLVLTLREPKAKERKQVATFFKVSTYATTSYTHIHTHKHSLTVYFYWCDCSSLSGCTGRRVHPSNSLTSEWVTWKTL